MYMILGGLLLSALPILLAIIFGLCKSNSIESKMEYGIAANPTRGTWLLILESNTKQRNDNIP